MPPAARITDMHACPVVDPGPKPHVGGPIITGSPNVFSAFLPQARVTDKAICVGPVDSISRGSATVRVNNLAAARQGDPCVHGGAIVTGAPNVLIGDASAVGAGKPCLTTAAAAGAAFVKP